MRKERAEDKARHSLGKRRVNFYKKGGERRNTHEKEECFQFSFSGNDIRNKGKYSNNLKTNEEGKSEPRVPFKHQENLKECCLYRF